mgnify:CR=1 FL=1
MLFAASTQTSVGIVLLAVALVVGVVYAFVNLRQARPDRMSPDQQPPLGLDVHLLLTAWAGNPQDELLPMAWAVRRAPTRAPSRRP